MPRKYLMPQSLLLLCLQRSLLQPWMCHRLLGRTDLYAQPAPRSFRIFMISKLMRARLTSLFVPGRIKYSMWIMASMVFRSVGIAGEVHEMEWSGQAHC